LVQLPPPPWLKQMPPRHWLDELQLAAYPSEPTGAAHRGAKCVSKVRPGKEPKEQMVPLAHCVEEDAREQHVSAHWPLVPQIPERHVESVVHAVPPMAEPDGAERPIHEGATQY
jgi:hypothetical protein